MKVSAIFVATGAAEAAMLRRLAAGAPRAGRRAGRRRERARQPTRASLPSDVRVVENERPLGFSANVNKGIAATSGEYVVISNPDAVPEAGCIAGARRASLTRIRGAVSPVRRC